MNLITAKRVSRNEADRAGAFGHLALLVIAALLAILLTAGCTTTGAPYAPETSFTARTDLDALKVPFGVKHQCARRRSASSSVRSGRSARLGTVS